MSIPYIPVEKCLLSVGRSIDEGERSIIRTYDIALVAQNGALMHRM